MRRGRRRGGGHGERGGAASRRRPCLDIGRAESPPPRAQKEGGEAVGGEETEAQRRAKIAEWNLELEKKRPGDDNSDEKAGAIANDSGKAGNDADADKKKTNDGAEE